MAYDVFISYSSHDQKIVEGLSACLEQNGIRCFVAYRDIPRGIVWAEAITSAIEECRMMIVVFSEHFNRSPQVNREIELCSEEGKPILTFRLQNIAFTGAKKYYLKNLNWIDAFPEPEQFFGNLCESAKRLLPADLNTRTATTAMPASAPPSAPSQPEPLTNQCILKIRPNLDCVLYVDDERRLEAPAGKITKLPLNRGTFQLEFVGMECKDDKYILEEYRITDPEQLLSVDLESIAQKRREKERQEKEQRDNERFLEETEVWYQRGERDFEAKDCVKAAEWYRKAAEQGHAAAQNNLGRMYDNGQGVPKDYSIALEWYRKAAEQGFAGAQNNLGLMYYNGQGVPKDYSIALEWYRKAAEQGHAVAQRNLGLMYCNGEGVRKDFDKAVEWYRKAAEQGEAGAQNNLGLMYGNGQGVPKDHSIALEWHRKAAEQGDATAQRNLGVMYWDGRGVPQDYAKAAEWYRKAAEQGYADVQNILGAMYQHGLGVPQDYAKAAEWYSKAAEQGLKEAKKALEKLRKKGYG